MPKAGFIVTRVSFLVLAASMLSAGMLAVPAVAQASTCPSSVKCFAVDVSPKNPPAGANTSFSFTITNESSPQTLGSVKITAPAGFSITDAGPGKPSVTSSSALFTGLNLTAATPATLTVTATVTASAACSSVSPSQWGIQAKQSNDFNGPPGNNFQLDPASANNLLVTPTAPCSLKFTGEPSDTAAGAKITTAVGSQGGPVTVEVLDGAGNVDTSSAAPVTIAIGNNPNPGSASLSGTTTVDASQGVASFSDLSINADGTGYTLVATSPGITSATSSSFNISQGVAGPCTGASCSGSASSQTTTGTVVVTSPTNSGEFLETGIRGFAYSCPGYSTVSDPFSFDLVNSAGIPDQTARFSGTLRIDKSVVSAHPGASSWQLCYASQQSFTPRSGTQLGKTTIDGVTYFTGLLPDCSGTQGSPCVQARNKNNAGDEIVTFLAVGDPVAKG